MQRKKKSYGFTLLELLTTVAVLCIVVTAAIPSFDTMVTNNQIKSKSEELFSFVRLAKYEAVKRNTNIEVFFDSSEQGFVCIGMQKVGGKYKCQNKNDTFSILKFSDEFNFNMKTSDANDNAVDLVDGKLFTFDSHTGKSSDNKRVLLQSSKNKEIISGIRVTNIGFVTPCSDQSWGGKKACLEPQKS